MSGYVELLCRTNFSFLQGASHPHELVHRAKEIGHNAIGIADEASLAGMVRAHQAAEEVGIKLLVGARIRPVDGAEVFLYVTCHDAYVNLSRLITLGRRAAPKGEYRLKIDDIADFNNGLLAIVPACRHLRERRLPELISSNESGRYVEIFGDRAYLALTRHLDSRDAQRVQEQHALAETTGIPMVAANDAYMHIPSRKPLLDVITCIREGCSAKEAGWLLFSNSERYLKEETRMRALFPEHLHAVERTCEVSERCNFSMNELKYEYPHHDLVPEGTNATEYLATLVHAGAKKRYPEGIPDGVAKAVQQELNLIEELKYEGYFLTVWDIVRFAREEDILCQGRGSAANSSVCYCLGITEVDPARHELLFERFVSKERQEPPDIDVDFENAKREKVFEYIYNKYGRHRAGITANVVTYRRKSALREVSKVFGFSLDQQGALTKYVDTLSDIEAIKSRLRDAGFDPESETAHQVIRLARELRGFPRHLSQHVGGFVITKGRLDDLVPIENAAMDDRTVVQWNKDDLDALGILKIDCLALGMLTAIGKCLVLLEAHHGKVADVSTILKTDIRDPSNPREPDGEARGVYDMICEADTIGVFQIESRAQMQMLPRLRPRSFYDLVIEVAIVRPGPIMGNMVHPYLNRRSGKEDHDYPHDKARPILERTLGVPLFQEQVMSLAVAIAGYTPGESDQLRRDMAAWKRTGSMEYHREKLLTGMQEREISQEFAERVFEQIKGFSEYGFPESHAASFALLVYVSCYLKRYYPAAFACSLLNSMPLGFYSVGSIVRDAREHGVEVRPPDVNFSTYDSTLEEVIDGIASDDPTSWGKGGPALRLGLREITGIEEDVANRIVAARATRSFTDLSDFNRRTGTHRKQLVKLATGDAFLSLGVDRRQALWRSQVEMECSPLLAEAHYQEQAVTLPTVGLHEHVIQDYASIGLSLRAHPLKLIRDQLEVDGLVTSKQLRSFSTNAKAEIAGIVLCRQRPGTASGVVFLTLEDETGVANIIVWSTVFEKYRRFVRLAKAMRVYGKVQRDETGKVVNLIAERISPLNASPASFYTTSRDFH